VQDQQLTLGITARGVKYNFIESWLGSRKIFLHESFNETAVLSAVSREVGEEARS
jgi:hypothetical protein